MKQNINWDEIFKKYAEQNIADAVFCRQENISPSAFYKKKKSRGIARPYKRRQQANKSTAKPEIVELSISPEQIPSANTRTPTIRLTNMNGVTIEVFL